MSNKKLTVLFAPLDYHGHVNACHGIAETLRERGHRVVFAIDNQFEGKLKVHGFDEEIISVPLSAIGLSDKVEVDPTTDIVLSMMDVFKEGTLAMTEKFCILGFENMTKFLKSKESQHKELISRIKPDIIFIDSYVGSPTLTDSGIPWVWLYSAAPLLAWNNEKLPPPWSGFPTNGNTDEWKEYREKFEPLFQNLYNMVNSWYAETNAPPLPSKCQFQTHPSSKYLNICMTPKELHYDITLTDNWRRVDGFVRSVSHSFEIPEPLREKSGKLVFLSMGSIGCSHLELMKRLVQILSKSEHRFIVAMGPVHDRYQLPENMWGQAFVPQTAVLPMIDLVITHGGNNTVTETFFYGKPMLVMPLFGDQFENAQRVQETGLGLRLNPFECSEDELLSSVDRLVNDLELKERMKTIGERIRSNNDKEIIAHLIENIIENNNKN